MKITPTQLRTILKNGKKNRETLRQVLLYIFSFKENIDVFSLFLFPETVTNTIPEFHREIYETLFKEGDDALAAPRGHGKSSITGLIFLIYCIVHKLDRYIVYISENHTKTVQFLDPVRYEFKNNKRLRWLYGSIIVELDKDKDGKDREDCFDINGIRVEAVSFEKNLRGFKYRNFRPTLIICDDIENDSRVLNPELRIKDANKLNKIIIPSLDINGRLKFIGTILHIDSLLLNKIKLYNGRIYTACDSKFENILWPERFNKDKLKKIKKSIGSLPFQQEYLNNPADNVSSIIKREWVTQCFDETLSYEDTGKMHYDKRVLGVDFAFSDRITADNSSFVSIGQKDSKYYFMHAELRHGMSITEQMNHISNNLYIKYKHDNIGLEENSIKSISKDIGKFNLPITLFWTGASDPATQQDEIYKDDYIGKRYTVGKINLIQRLSVAFENKRFVIPYKTDEDKAISNRILEECTSYALADGKLVEGGIHPDYPIAIGYCLEQLTRMVHQVDFFFG